MNGKKGGLGNVATGIIWALIVVGGVLAVFQQLDIKNPEGALAYIKEKSAYYVQCIPAGDCGLPLVVDDIVKPVIDGDTNGNEGIIITVPERADGGLNLDGILLERESRGEENKSPYINDAGLVNKESSLAMLDNLSKIKDIDDKEIDVGYSRREWKHWKSLEGKSCWSTREEILYRDSIPGTIVLMDKNKNLTNDYNEACAIGKIIDKDGKMTLNSENSGIWIDPYSGVEITNASDVDIDHIIPLSNAARNGGQAWTAELKEKFANDPDNLLATSAKENRSKGDKGPAEYMPLQKSGYRCPYAKAYITIAYKYELTITDSDYDVLQQAVSSCQN